MNKSRGETEPAPADEGKATPSQGVPPKHRPGSWWWGVIPAVAAVGILAFWLTGQFEEMFGIDPRGTWKAEPTTITVMHQPAYGDPIPMERRITWGLFIDDAAGDLWLKLDRNKEEILVGPVTVNENNIYLESPRGSFNGVYYTDAEQFRYHIFARRYIECVIRLGPGDAYSLTFERE